MPLGIPITGGITPQSRITGGITPLNAVKGGVRSGQQENLNFVVIQFDDGGAEWFNWSGLQATTGGHALTPRLDEMRGRGVAFTRAYACPICAPSRARMRSGLYGFDVGLAGNPVDGEDFAFGGGGAPLSDPTNVPPITLKLIPRLVRLGRTGSDTSTVLSSYPYQQATFGKSHLQSLSGRETWECDHGVGRYIGCQPNAGVLPVGDDNTGHFHFTEITHNAGGTPTSKVWGSAGTWPSGGPYVAYDTSVEPDACWDAYKVYRDAISWINSRTSPFIAFVNFNPPHAPFEVPPYTAPDDVGQDAPGGTFNLIDSATQAAMTALDGGSKGPGYEASDPASVRAVFRANIQAIDSLIGKLWDRMEPTRRDKTVFAFIGDNGTVVQAVDSPYEPSHGKRSLYEQGSRVPCVVWGPPSLITSPGRASDHLLHIVDVFPTLMELALCDPALWNPGGTRKVRGRSFSRVLRDPAATPARDHIYNERFDPLTATINGPVAIDQTNWVRSYTDGVYKIIRNAQGVTPLYEFYRIDSTIQPASGMPGYFEKSADNLYGLVGTAGNEILTARFQALVAAMESLLAS